MSISIRVNKSLVTSHIGTREVPNCGCSEQCDCCSTETQEFQFWTAPVRVPTANSNGHLQVFPFGKNFGTSVSSFGGDLLPHVEVVG